MSPQPPVECLTILVVDDERLLVRTLKRALEHLGHTVLATQDPDQGVELARAHKPDVALIDLDLGEGKENGHSLCSRIREFEPATVVFMWSGAPPDGVCYDSLRAGAVEHLVKPVPIDVLLAKFRARVKLQRESVPPPTPPPDFPFALDKRTGEVTRRGEPVDLGPDQERLLLLLLRRRDCVVTFAEIRKHVGSACDKAAKRLVYRTQRKLGDDGAFIENAYSIGFILRSVKKPTRK